MAHIPIVFLILSLLSPNVRAQQNNNLITLGSSLSPNSSWSSPSGFFAFGFYPHGNEFAVGIWISGEPENTVVWTANRDDPPLSSNAVLDFTIDGRLLLRTGQGEEKSIAELPEPAASASMLDSGNLVIYNIKSQVIWQSFDFPTDTILGGQNLSSNMRLVSNTSKSDYSSGWFSLNMQLDGNLVAYPVNSSNLPEESYWSSGILGPGYSAKLNLDQRGVLSIQSGSNSSLRTLTVVGNSTSLPNSTNEMVIYRASLDADGVFRLYSHSLGINNSGSTSIVWRSLDSQCEVKGFCGINSFCQSNVYAEANCSCFPGFEFVNTSNKKLGCYRSFIDEEVCQQTGTAARLEIVENITLLGYPYSVQIESMNKENCRKSCLEDCNCGLALYLSGRCKKHKLPLRYAAVNQQIDQPASTAFLRVPDDDQLVETKGMTTLFTILAVSLGSAACLCSFIAIYSFFMYRNQALKYKVLSENAKLGIAEDYTLRSFFYDDLEKATDGFKEELGRGSFGAVYKGTVSVGRGTKVVAVKRLENIVEGEREFMAEMTAIGSTYHRNLVQLLGYCIEGSRRLLVYNYMSNGSLADLLFKPEKRRSWKERVRMALEVARGIIYLHEECEAQIIHCNIKPQNILMDDSWCAKISDFGLAKLLKKYQSTNAMGVRGRSEYSAPEWQHSALMSAKVDVYSFGIVLLEIVCCRRDLEVNISTEEEIVLSAWVYNCFVAQELHKLVGEDEEVDMNTLERMVKVGLLCIEDNPSLRPPMKNVILMLEGTMDIPNLSFPNPLAIS